MKNINSEKRVANFSRKPVEKEERVFSGMQVITRKDLDEQVARIKKRYEATKSQKITDYTPEELKEIEKKLRGE